MKVLMLNGSFNPDGSTNAGLEIMAKTFAAEGVHLWGLSPRTADIGQEASAGRQQFVR